MFRMKDKGSELFISTRHIDSQTIFKLKDGIGDGDWANRNTPARPRPQKKDMSKQIKNSTTTYTIKSPLNNLVCRLAIEMYSMHPPR